MSETEGLFRRNLSRFVGYMLSPASSGYSRMSHAVTAMSQGFMWVAFPAAAGFTVYFAWRRDPMVLPSLFGLVGFASLACAYAYCGGWMSGAERERMKAVGSKTSP